MIVSNSNLYSRQVSLSSGNNGYNFQFDFQPTITKSVFSFGFSGQSGGVFSTQKRKDFRF